MSREYLNISAWHGTTQVIAQKIRREGFKYVEIDFGSQRLRNPNDLGAGVYFFVDSSHELGRVLANNYARTFRNKKAEAQRCSLEVLEATICVKNNMLLDLDATDIMGVFVDFRKKHELEREK